MEPLALESTGVPGLLLVHAARMEDERGDFVKTFDSTVYAARGIATSFSEHFHTTSARGVVRGLHFQSPPFGHDKLVFCVSGQAFDVVVDVRVGSPTFGVARTFDLNERDGIGLYVPEGCAHGFAALVDRTTLSYAVTSGHAPEHDDGILWSSVDVAWPFPNPILSARDARLPSLEDLTSPFVFKRED